MAEGGTSLQPLGLPGPLRHLPRARHHVLQQPQGGGAGTLAIQLPVHVNPVVVLPDLPSVTPPVWAVAAARGAASPALCMAAV